MNMPVLPAGLAKHPRLGQWLDIGPDGLVRAYSGKVELGQGIAHALRLIVAEELQLDPDQVVMVRASTATRSCPSCPLAPVTSQDVRPLTLRPSWP